MGKHEHIRNSKIRIDAYHGNIPFPAYPQILLENKQKCMISYLILKEYF